VAEDFPNRRSGLDARSLTGETVVLDRRLRRIHQLNQTASFIWERCDGRHAVGEIAAQMARDFDVDLETARRDAAAAVARLAEAGLLEPAPVRGGPPPAE
jgi:hypothetical protein